MLSIDSKANPGYVEEVTKSNGIFHQAGLILINAYCWIFFTVTSFVLVIGAAVIRILTGFFDPNLRILHTYSCFWASLYLWFNPFWSLKKRGLKGVDPSKAYVIVSNHQSMVDIVILFNTFLHFKWVSKKTMFNAPFLGWNMRMNGYVPIDRGNDESREKCLEACRAWLAKGSSVLFFPEGTRSTDGKMLPFKIGAFRLAVESGHDVLPIVIQGPLDAVPKHSILLHRRSKMTLEVLPPISVHSYMGNPSGAESLMNHTRTMIKAKLGQ